MMHWDEVLADIFRELGLESWPDVAGENANMLAGHVVWEMIDEDVADTLDGPPSGNPVVELDFRSSNRMTTQKLRQSVMASIDEAGLLVSIIGGGWYVDEDLDLRGTRVEVVLSAELE